MPAEGLAAASLLIAAATLTTQLLLLRRVAAVERKLRRTPPPATPHRPAPLAGDRDYTPGPECRPVSLGDVGAWLAEDDDPPDVILFPTWNRGGEP